MCSCALLCCVWKGGLSECSYRVLVSHLHSSELNKCVTRSSHLPAKGEHSSNSRSGSKCSRVIYWQLNFIASWSSRKTSNQSERNTAVAKLKLNLKAPHSLRSESPLLWQLTERKQRVIICQYNYKYDCFRIKGNVNIRVCVRVSVYIRVSEHREKKLIHAVQWIWSGALILSSEHKNKLT